MQRQVAVTPARWWHMPGLSRLIRETRRKRLAPPGEPGKAILWAPRWSPSLGLLQSIWSAPVAVGGAPRSLVAEVDGRPLGLGQMRPRKEPRQWDVAYLAVEEPPRPATAGDAGAHLLPDRNAARLLGALCDTGAAAGAERMLARIAEDGGYYDLFRQLGFSPAVREYTYFRGPSVGFGARNGRALAAQAIPGLRPQRRGDAFGLLQLYQDCTPKMIQMAEGKRSHSWESAEGILSRRLTRRRTERWVVERDTRKVAWLQVRAAAGEPHEVTIMVDERASGLSAQLLDFTLALVAPHARDGVLVRAREHQQMLIGALEQNTFDLLDIDLLMVKLLATPVLQPQFATAFEKVV